MAEINYKTALIVGVGSGLSASLARLFAKNGMKVALAARRADNLAALAKETGAKSFVCDATKRADVTKLFADVEAALGAPDVVVYNASYRTRGPFVELVPDEVAKAIAVTAFGAFLVAQEAAKRMVPQHHGAILFTGASAGVKGYAAVGAVCHGQIRAARTGAKHGARTIAAGHPRRAFRHRRRHQKRAPARSAGQARQHARSRRDRARAICICCSSRAAPGPGKSNCGHGSRSFEFGFAIRL